MYYVHKTHNQILQSHFTPCNAGIGTNGNMFVKFCLWAFVCLVYLKHLLFTVYLERD